MSEKRVLVKKDTVLFGDFLTHASDERSKAIDLIYNVSHLWSLRASERAFDSYDKDIEFTNALRPTIKGVENVKVAVLGFHDPLDDFHITLEEFVFEGSLKEGHAATRYKMTGNWVRPIGGIVQPSKVGVEIAIAAYIFYKIKDEKIVAINVVASNSDVPEFEAGFMALMKAQQEQKQN